MVAEVGAFCCDMMCVCGLALAALDYDIVMWLVLRDLCFLLCISRESKGAADQLFVVVASTAADAGQCSC